MTDYNGPKTDLMDELYGLFVDYYGEPEYVPDEAVLSLYLTRACSILEERGWRKVNDRQKRSRKQDC
ncbi:hypothetical protein ES708_00712 [subsurface metagenome]